MKKIKSIFLTRTGYDKLVKLVPDWMAENFANFNIEWCLGGAKVKPSIYLCISTLHEVCRDCHLEKNMEYSTSVHQ